jgi:hypothetical protein
MILSLRMCLLDVHLREGCAIVIATITASMPDYIYTLSSVHKIPTGHHLIPNQSGHLLKLIDRPPLDSIRPGLPTEAIALSHPANHAVKLPLLEVAQLLKRSAHPARAQITPHARQRVRLPRQPRVAPPPDEDADKRPQHHDQDSNADVARDVVRGVGLAGGEGNRRQRDDERFGKEVDKGDGSKEEGAVAQRVWDCDHWVRRCAKQDAITRENWCGC